MYFESIYVAFSIQSSILHLDRISLHMELTLEDISSSIWQMLASGAADKKDAFQRMNLVSLGNPYPEVRTVILRKVIQDEAVLLCHSDSRSAKVPQIEEYPYVSWQAWHPKRRVQLRLYTRSTVWREGELLEDEWKRIQGTSRLNYSAIRGPGSSIGHAKEGWESYATVEDIEAPISDSWKEHFCVIHSQVEKIDWLKLERGKNARAMFVREEGAWKGEWLIP